MKKRREINEKGYLNLVKKDLIMHLGYFVDLGSENLILVILVMTDFVVTHVHFPVL